MAGEGIPESDEKNGAGFAWIALRVCAILTVYVLSSGPAMWLHAKTASPAVQSGLQMVYAPVVFLINKTPLSPVGAWWVYQWVDVPETRTWLPQPP